MMELGIEELEQRVIETVRTCQRTKEGDPLVWAMEIGKCVMGLGGELPSVELGEVIVSQLCFSNNHPSLWKFLNEGLSSGLLYPLHVLSLLTSRIVPHRLSQPEAYRLYLELLWRYAFSLHPLKLDACRKKIITSIDAALQLSQTNKLQVLELGHATVLCFCTIVIRLVDSILDDWGLKLVSVRGANGAVNIEDSQNMDVDSEGIQVGKRVQHRESVRRTNSIMAIEVLAKLTESRKAISLLRIAHVNMPEMFNGLMKELQFLDARKFPPSGLKTASLLLQNLLTNIHKALVLEPQLNRRQLVGMLIDNTSCKMQSCLIYQASQFSCWIAFDVCMENAMDGKQFPATSAIDTLTETIIMLQVFNRATWHETFLALWLSALRLVQRERDPLEGPIPHLEARLCILLSIVPLATARVLGSGCEPAETKTYLASRRQGLISSLQNLGQYTNLLCPPASVVTAANVAAAKAASFISKTNNVNVNTEGGNMRHLIVEACIARNLIDTSVYLGPGYICGSIYPSDMSADSESSWSTFMEGAPLRGPLVNALITTPASSLAEIEKLYHIALNGKKEDKSAAAKILCGASLSCGWNFQEHVVHFVIKLLSPPMPTTFTESESHLLEYMPMLGAVLSGITFIDTVHILSLHGKVPEVAAALMPLCEAFGSLVPTSSHESSSPDESSVYTVFSSAFLFLMRLWKFYRPPLDQCIAGTGGPIRSELTLEYLLLLRNSRLQPGERNGSNNMHNPISDRPIYIDSCPKLRAWYCQNKLCIASTLSGVSSGNPVHQVADKILNMLYGKINKPGTSSGNSSTPSSSSLSSPSSTSREDALMLPAWEVLEAVPFILEAILTACTFGRLSSRDLTTGLRDLVDFLPASLASIVSYLSAEVTRGIWKPVPMNGIEWPSPAANFTSVESEIKEILSAIGVDVPSCSSGVSPAMLPLPMAALVSLTITFKLEKSMEYIHAVAGPALENCASSCPWPCMPIIGSLWSQKVRRWHDFIVVSCSRSVFRQSKEAIAQLLRSCFTSFLGSINPSSSSLTSQHGVNGLLGNFISAPGLLPRVAPGFLYLRSCRTIHQLQYINHVIIGLVAEFARESATKWASAESPRLKSTQASLAIASSRAKEVATLGASLLSVAGGLQLVQELYQETMPTWLILSREEKLGEVISVTRIVEGYAMAYLMVLSGASAWGVGAKQPSSTILRRSRIIGAHLDFLADALNGNISLGCDAVTWRAYVSCLVGLVVSFSPIWIREFKQNTLKTLAKGLRGWHESELALSLLERGGTAAMGSLAELLNSI